MAWVTWSQAGFKCIIWESKIGYLFLTESEILKVNIGQLVPSLIDAQ
jgi:hypothetical protein